MYHRACLLLCPASNGRSFASFPEHDIRRGDKTDKCRKRPLRRGERGPLNGYLLTPYNGDSSFSVCAVSVCPFCRTIRRRDATRGIVFDKGAMVVRISNNGQVLEHGYVLVGPSEVRSVHGDTDCEIMSNNVEWRVAVLRNSRDIRLRSAYAYCT